MTSAFKDRLKNILLGNRFTRSILFNRQIHSYQGVEFSEGDVTFLFFQSFLWSGRMIDVGAHYGESFAPYEALGWEIIAFEPDPENRKRIVSTSPRTNIFDVAVTDKDDQQVTLYTSSQSSGISTLSPFHQTHEPSVVVKTTTLTTFLKDRRVTNIDFLKIDAEGYDMFVLKGFPFESIKPVVVLCEFEDRKTITLGYSHKELAGSLLKHDYVVYISEWTPIVEYGAHHSWKSIRLFREGELKDSNAWGNFLAIRKDYAPKFDHFLKMFLSRRRKGHE